MAVAAGRASPQIKNEADARLKPVKAPTVAEAEALGQLILLAEDNPTNQDVIRRQLNLLGRACEIVSNGAEALKSYQSGRYGLILTDCHMPVMDGYELTGHIRGSEGNSGRRIPIVAVTANALQGEAERCLAAGMDDYVSKPIAMPALVSVLEKWMPVPRGVTTAAKPKSAPSSQTGWLGKNGSEADAPSDAGIASSGNGRGPAIDERAIKDMFGEDPETFRETLQSFVAPSISIIDALLTAREKRAARDVKDEAHKLKSSARSIGAHSLADICTALEQAGKAADWTTIDTLVPDARDAFGRVRDFIEAL